MFRVHSDCDIYWACFFLSRLFKNSSGVKSIWVVFDGGNRAKKSLNSDAEGGKSSLRDGSAGFCFFSGYWFVIFAVRVWAFPRRCFGWSVSGAGRSLDGRGWSLCDEYDDPYPWHWESHSFSYESQVAPSGFIIIARVTVLLWFFNRFWFFDFLHYSSGFKVFYRLNTKSNPPSICVCVCVCVCASLTFNHTRVFIPILFSQSGEKKLSVGNWVRTVGICLPSKYECELLNFFSSG